MLIVKSLNTFISFLFQVHHQNECSIELLKEELKNCFQFWKSDSIFLKTKLSTNMEWIHACVSIMKVYLNG